MIGSVGRSVGGKYECMGCHLVVEERVDVRLEVEQLVTQCDTLWFLQPTVPKMVHE